MDAQQVVKMMDAIYDGKDFRFGVKTKAESPDGMSVQTTAESVTFLEPVANFKAVVDDTRNAREIALALVTWADRKDREKLGKAIPTLNVEQWEKDLIEGGKETQTAEDLDNHELSCNCIFCIPGV